MSELEFRVAIHDAIAEELERDPAVRVLRRGRRRRAGRRVRRHTGPPGALRRRPRLRHPDLRAGARRRRVRRRGHRPAAGDRDHVRGLHGAADGFARQPGGKAWYVSNEQGSVPLVVRSAVGAGGRFGAMHSQTHGTWFQGIPGIKIVAPSSPGDAKGAAEGGDPRSTIRCSSSSTSGSTRSRARSPRPRRSRSARPRSSAQGAELTIVSIAKGVRDALQAADTLSGDGLDVEVVDLRSLRPLDLDTVLASVAKTNRILAVEEGPRTGGWASGLIGAVAEAACTTSTTPGSSPPARPRSPTARHSRTTSCPTPRRSSRRSGRGLEPGWRQPRE